MKNEPLYLPKGSIRAILAIIVTTFVCTALYYKIDLPEWFVITWAGIVGLYFGNRQNANGSNQKNEQ